MAKCYVKAFFDWIEQVSALEDDEKGRLFVAILEYARSGEVPDMQGRESILFPVFKSQIDRDMESSTKQSENGKKGGRPRTKTESEENQNKPKQTKRKLTKANKEEKDKEKDKDKEEDKEEDKEKDKEEDKEETPFSPPSQGGTPPRPRIPYDSIRDAYNEICQSFPKCNALSDKRKAAIRARIHSGGYTFADFQRLFRKAEASAFLRGENKKNWRATFDWLLADANMAKVLDGNYDDNRSTVPGNRSARVSNAPAPGPCSPVTAADVDRSWAEMERMQRELGVK